MRDERADDAGCRVRVTDRVRVPAVRVGVRVRAGFRCSDDAGRRTTPTFDEITG